MGATCSAEVDRGRLPLQILDRQPDASACWVPAAGRSADGVVVGIDPSTTMIGCTSRSTRHARSCRFQVGAAERLEFPTEHFDVVVSSLVMHHLPKDLRAAAVQEMWRVLRPAGRLFVAEAQTPRHGSGWRLLARAHGYDRMARMVPHLEPLAAVAGFGQIQAGEAPPWLRYVRAIKATNAT